MVNSSKPKAIGYEIYGPERLADLLLRIETLLAWGYGVSVNPPQEPPTVDVTSGFAS